jgi:diguanylate cyclase (GGDEF)-like protein
METNLRPEWTADGSHVVGVHMHVQDVTQRKLETLRLSRISRLDHLTQLLNRGAFESLLQTAMARSREEGRLMALLYLDMDRFKAVNDFHGHITGDLLLQAFGRRLQRCVRERDTVARLGGDEFAVVLEDIGGSANAQRIAQAIVHSVSRRFFIDGVFADVDVSIGVALYRGAPMPDQALMRQADTLLYRAKAAGRGRFEMGPPDLLDKPDDARA